VDVYYCGRHLTNWPTTGQNIWQSVVTEIDSVPGCAGSITTETFLTDITNGVQADVELNINPNYITNCNGYTSSFWIESYLPACMKAVSTSSGYQRVEGGCSSNGGYCKDRCNICNNNGSIQVSNCVFSVYGSPNCGGGNAPNLISGWSAGTCYQIPCGTN